MSVYLWNPRPVDGETVKWEGDYIQDGQYRFADGHGITTWYRYGEVTQIDEGSFEHGKRHGNFQHQFFPSGDLGYSKWEHGKDVSEVPSKQVSTNNADNAKRAFIEYHQNLTDKNYRQAYSMMTDNQKNRIGTYDSWVQGYSDTLKSTVDEMSLVSSSANTCTFNYTLTARDRFRGSVKVQVFKGEVTMIQSNGHWYIDSAMSKKVSEHVE